jgi:hypothetical protein
MALAVLTACSHAGHARIVSAVVDCGPTDLPVVMGQLSRSVGGATVEAVDAQGTSRGVASRAFVRGKRFEITLLHDRERGSSIVLPLPAGGTLVLRDGKGRTLDRRRMDLSVKPQHQCG